MKKRRKKEQLVRMEGSRKVRCSANRPKCFKEEKMYKCVRC